mgnify:CR=1 FL=1
MIIDINAYLGNWPFRRLPATTSDEVVKLLDRAGVDIAVVSSLNSVLYADTNEGNLELIEEVRNYSKRFIPFAVLNPKYPGWAEDLAQCVESGFKGIRLYPQYHNYLLDDEDCLKLVSEASELGLVISIPVRLRDRRGRHWMDSARDIGFHEIEALATKSPHVKIVILESRDVAKSSLVNHENLYFEISRMPSVLQEMPELIRSIGPSRLMFGSGVPLKYVTPAILKVKHLREPEEIKERILWKNASDLLGLGIQENKT